MLLLGKGDVSVFMKTKVSFDDYDGFVSRRVNVKVSFENCVVKPFKSMCDL